MGLTMVSKYASQPVWLYDDEITMVKHAWCLHWAVQAGLLTPLTFTQHCLSPLATFTSGAYFLHSGRRWQWICEVYTANFKDIFEGLELECVWQQATTCCSCYKMSETTFFPRTLNFLVSWKMRSRHFFPPSITFPCHFCNCNSGGICTAWQF